MSSASIKMWIIYTISPAQFDQDHMNHAENSRNSRKNSHMPAFRTLTGIGKVTSDIPSTAEGWEQWPVRLDAADDAPDNSRKRT